MEGKPSDGRDYSTWMNVARFSCTRALGDGPPNVEPFNGGVSIESRLFPKRVCIAQRTSFKWKGENSKGPSMKQGQLTGTNVKQTNFNWERPSMQGNLQISNGKRRSKQAKHAMRTGQI
ncbi:hypothetical protein TNCV_4388771 [Trichonephila clavipes]|nr:hypothetical protein TNCV_4388771 [Trichonephila clavipes]